MLTSQHAHHTGIDIEQRRIRVIARQQALATNFRYFLNFGVSYTFGSIFNTVVNPRFNSVRGGGGGKRHVLAILPGSRKLDFDAVAALFEARKCGFASPATAQELTGCVMGSVPPFALNPALTIVVEQDLLANETLFFNAGRLDRSMELDTRDWIAVAKPRIARIAAAA